MEFFERGGHGIVHDPHASRARSPRQPATLDDAGFGSKVYYGDASRLDVLRAAGAERAELLVLAIDDVEASVRIAQLAHERFPHL